MSQVEIREGFLCPICLTDLGTVSHLQSHFEDVHSTEDKAVFQQLKGFLDKAKRKILKAIDDEDDDDIPGAPSSAPSAPGARYSMNVRHVSRIDPVMWEPQELGATRSHTDAFKAVRDARVDRYVVETNKLLIRLDKLITSELPPETSKRKAFEKSIVPWVHDGDVSQCPACGKTFSLTRRRHHCRLCGFIVCNRCSQFLPYTYAKKLTNPAFRKDNGESGFLQRSDSSQSISSIVSSEGELHIRTCPECRKLLERRDDMVEARNLRPTVVLLYEKMKTCIEESEILLPKYTPMFESLSRGETTYNLFDAMKLRTQLLKLFEAVDLLSKKIMVLDIDSEDSSSTPRRYQLQKSIRSYASSFLQDNMLGLQSLPSEDEYAKLQKQRDAEIERRLAQEREAAAAREITYQVQVSPTKNLTPQRNESQQDKKLPTHKRNNSQESFFKKLGQVHKRSDSQDGVGAGWKPAENALRNVTRGDDPMVQQMDIIRGYIKQAKQVQKWDEVEMLEQNLKELQDEYWKMQKT